MAGNPFARWYAMRQRLMREGRWHGRRPPAHSVPEREEGEPAAKEARISEPESANTPDSLPELEAPITAEGELCLTSASRCLHGLKTILLFLLTLVQKTRNE